MRRFLVLALGVALLVPGSGVRTGRAQLSADTFDATGAGCVSAAQSFNGQAYCVDGNHAAAFAPLDPQVVAQLGIADLNGWQVPTRCEGNGKSGKRVQLVYVHIKGSPSTFGGDLPLITQRLIPGANGVFEHSSQGKRAVRWVTTKQAGACVPTVMRVTLPKSLNNKGYPYNNIGRALEQANPEFRRTDRNFLVLIDTPDHPYGRPLGDCGLGSVRYDSSPGAGNRNNAGQSFAMVWRNCWTGLVTAHELTHTMGAVQPTAPHKTDLGHCWDGRDDMCYADGSRQKQRLVCTKANDFRKLDCKGDDYFSLSPKKGSYLARHWNSAASQFLIESKARALPVAPSLPAVTTSVVDATHLQVSWTPGPPRPGKITSWTVSVSPTDRYETETDDNGRAVDLLATHLTVGGGARSAVVTVQPDVMFKIGVNATNASGDGPAATVTAGAGAPPSPIVGTFRPSGSGGYVDWTGGVSDPTLLTCTAVLVNGLRPYENQPGETVDNTTDPMGHCVYDSPGFYVSALSHTDVLEIYARNIFGVTRVTVAHP